MNYIQYIKFIVSFCILFASFPGSGSASNKEENKAIQADKSHEKNKKVVFFDKSYIGFGLGNNFPSSRSKEYFKPGKKSLSLSYRHNQNDSWMMGISANFRRFNKIESEDELAVWSINHEALRIIRIYHPFYAMPGVKILYLLPSTEAKFPLHRDDGYLLEIGFAASLNFTYKITKKFLFSLSIDRWRGTKTRLIQGIENQISLHYSLD